MKKLLCFTLALSAAMAVNAAAFKWKVNNGQEAEIGYKIYAVLGDTVVTSWANEQALVAASIGADKIGQVDNQGIYIGASGSLLDGSITPDKNFYLVIVDAASTKFASSAIYSGNEYVYTPPSAAPKTATFSMAGVSYTTFGTEPVPEPTSGLLVLVGLAGLMLRRKRV